MERMKQIRYSAASAKALCRRGTALLLDVCMLLSMFGGLGLFAPAAHAEEPSGGGTSGSGGTSGVTRQADASTMNDYQEMLDFSENTRYAGRIWSDKTVFALSEGKSEEDKLEITKNAGDREGDWNGTTLTLTPASDGVSDSIKLDEDFLHVYSVLGSSQQFSGVPPVRTVIVFDNSGSMYNSNSSGTVAGESGRRTDEALWKLQRIAMTLEAINRAIDYMMQANAYNEVAVVLFGDGSNNGRTAKDNTLLYEGQSTAVTILPMKHYTPQIDKALGYTPYLTGGWYHGEVKDSNGAVTTEAVAADGNTPLHQGSKDGENQKAYGAGWVFVNNDICKLKVSDKGTGDNPGHEWYNGDAWNGWNGCGANKYTAYQNGTTNIQAGYYVGMQELLRASKTEREGTVEYQCVPSLVMLTDGQTTDMMTGNFITPDTNQTSGEPTARGFVNDTGNKLRSFVGHKDKDAEGNVYWYTEETEDHKTTYKGYEKEIPNFWDMFVEKAKGAGGQEFFQSAAWHDGIEAEARVPDDEATENMKNVATRYSSSVASMVLGTLMTTAYYKEAVKREFKVKDDWNIYTISVDMKDPGNEIPDNAADLAKIADTNVAPKNELPKSWEYNITSNAAIMDPAHYFKLGDGNQADLQWLVNKGYLDDANVLSSLDGTANDVTTKTAYPDWSVGEMLIQGIVTAAEKLKTWGKTTGVTTKYEAWQEVTGILALDKDKKQTYTKDGVTWDAKRYVNPWGHGNGYFLEGEQTVTYPDLTGKNDRKEMNPYGLTKEDVLKNIGYNAQAYYPKTATGSAEELAQTFVEIMQAIAEPLFTPVGGMNDLGVSDSLTYMDPVGKYMDVKDVKKLVLFGQTYDITKTAVYDYQWNEQYMSNQGNGSTALTAGWYYGDPVVPAEGENGNADVQGPCSIEQVAAADKVVGDAPTGKRAEKAWEQGWVYRISYVAASQFIPTLEAIKTGEKPDETVTKMRNTEYTFYRIDDTEEVRTELHVNPVYLGEGQDEDTYLKNIKYDSTGARTHMSTPGVYALADLRIWVEDTGDYSDTTGGTLTDTNYDEALWVDIPQNMLPLRTVTIDLGKTGEAGAEWTYKTNVNDETDPAYKASFPLRVIYTVGVSSDVLEDDNRINVAGGLSAEYLKNNKITTAAAAAARGLDQGTVEFFSNWYNPENRYSDYAISSTEYSYGDPVTSFSPAAANRYYMFERALPLYSRAYVYNKGSAQWRRVVINEEESPDTSTFLPAKFGGVLRAQDLKVEGDAESITDAAATSKINEALGNPSDLKDGDIVLLADDILDDVMRPEGGMNDPFSSEAYFYLPIEYYTLNQNGTAELTKFVITRKGSEFGSAYKAAGITNGDMLCWHDMSGKYTQDYPYLSFTETGDDSRGKKYIGAQLGTDGWYTYGNKNDHTDLPNDDPQLETKHAEMVKGQNAGTWVVCAKPGGLRVGNLAQSVQEKTQGTDGSEILGEGGEFDQYESERFPDKAEDSSFSIRYYKGNVTRTANNYYMPTISSASDISDVKVNVYLGNNGRLWVEDTNLLVTKTVAPPEGSTEEVDSDEVFNYQIFLNQDDIESLSAAVVHWNANTNTWQRQYHYIDLQLDGQRFLQTTDGQKAMFDAAGRRVIANHNAGTEGAAPYLYADDPDTGYSDVVYYAYIDRNTSAESIGYTDTSFRVYHNNDVDDNGQVSTDDVTTGDATSGGPVTFSTKTACLVSQTAYDTVWNPADGPALDPVSDSDFDPIVEGSGTPIGSLALLTLDPNVDDTTDIAIDTPYLTNTAYWARTVNFGVQDLYDGIIPKADRPDYFPKSLTDEAIAKNTAEFTLKSGEGLLFSGIPSATVYRVTEKLTDAQIKAGYTLKEVSHTQQVGSTSTYRPGAQEIPVYYKADTTYVDFYGNDFFTTNMSLARYKDYLTEKGLTWAVKQDNGQTVKNDDAYLHYEPFHHTNAVVWDAYSTVDVNAQGNNHHQPTGVQPGRSTFWLWDEASQTSTNTGATHLVADNPSCYVGEGGADEAVEGNPNQVRHYFFKEGELRDVHYQGEGSGFIRNIARYITSPTVHFGVEGEKQSYAEEAMTEHTQSVDYTGVYSVFGNTGTFEESANFVNTLQSDKTETKINGKEVEPAEDAPNTYPGVEVGDEITYKINWANATTNAARVVIIDPLDDGVDFVSANEGGEFYEEQKDAQDFLNKIYGNAANKPKLDHGRVVIWDLGEKEKGTSGSVELTVKVNAQAREWWDYDDDGVADAPAGAEHDYLVRDRATVRVADNVYFTSTVENPVGQPDKTETKIERGGNGKASGAKNTPVKEDGPGANLKPGEGDKWHGPMVFPGDQITYEIEWCNYEIEPAAVTIRDPLDKNVRFVRASYAPTTFKGSDGQQIADGDQPKDSAGDPVKAPQDLKAAAEDRSTSTTTQVTGYGADGVETRPTITYTAKDATENPNTVTWNLGIMPSQAKGKVTLVVEVLDTALTEPYAVDNTAFVKVGNRGEQQTKWVENPTGPQKTETDPGDGETTLVGKEITYTISYTNDGDEARDVLIFDKLDDGVDFVSASDGGAYKADKMTLTWDDPTDPTDTPEKIEVPAHTVVWKIPNVPAFAHGEVTLTVKVNARAQDAWDYNADASDETPGAGVDDKVVNQARVKVDHDDWIKTQKPTNPIPEDHKHEVTPGEGKNVAVGDTVEYSIEWFNHKLTNSDVLVFDTLDPGVDYVDGSASNATYTDSITNEEHIFAATYYAEAGELDVNETSADPSDDIYVPARTLVWWIKDVPSQKNGTVTFKVKVNKNAFKSWGYGEHYGEDDWTPDPLGPDEDFGIINQARVKVGNDNWVLTEDPENPLTEKVETDPGDGKQVQIGDTIEYAISYRNDAEEAQDIIIYDKLDPGVDFYSASDEGKPYEEDTELNLGGEQVEVPAHTVIWELKNVGAGMGGTVTLKVKVNDNAVLEWNYKDDAADGSTDTGEDHKVVNQARVKVGNDKWFKTQKPTNTIPDKTETKAGDDDDLTLTPKPDADNTVTGPLVFVGEEITYSIHWENGHDTEADITITDPLDPGVDFVSAACGTVTLEADPVGGDVTESGTDTESGTEAELKYDAATHTVTWTLAKQAPGDSGDVELVVRVNEKASPKAVVENTAYVQVGDDAKVKTRTVENPTPHLDKTEVTPGDGVMVKVGDPITYEITWQNYHTEPARVIVMDTLDPGVDYDSCDNKGTYYPDGGEVPASGGADAVTIPERTVVWVFEDVPALTGGKVTLTVKVNEKAKIESTYTNDADGFNTNPDDKDFEVLDQARVKVGNDAFQKTRIVENPVPEKTETEAGAADNLTLTPNPDADNTYTGPLVKVGEPITYTITWKNGHDTAADVRIVDHLDPGVDFVSADNDGTYDEASHTVIWLLQQKPAGDMGSVTLTVRVNEKATPAGIVDNQASVKVDGDDYVETETIENPTPHLDKAEVTPGEGMQVMPGDEIDYQITWHNYEETEATVIVIDKLDPGVDFKAAGMDGAMSSAPTSGVAKPDKANLTVQLVGAAGVSANDDFTFTLVMTAPEGQTLGSYEWTKNGEPATGTWTESDNTFTLKPGQSLTLTDVPVGTLYTLKDENGSAVVSDKVIGSYGSAVTVTVEAQPNSEPQPAALSGDPNDLLINTPVPAPVDPVQPQEVTPAADEDTEGQPMGVRYKSPLLIKMNAEVLQGPDASEVIDGDANNEGSTTTEAAGEPATDPTETDPTVTGPTETDPTETDPTETDPTETDPTVTDPSETDPSVTGPTETGPTETGPSETDPSETGPTTTDPQTGTSDSAANGEAEEAGPSESSNGETAVTYTFSAVAEDLPEPGADDGIALMALDELEDYPELVDGFDPATRKLNGDEATVEYTFKDNKGRDVGVYYFAKAHTVVWVLAKRTSGEEGTVDLQVTVNENAEKFWSYEHPEWGPDDNKKDDRVRNQAGVKVGNNPKVNTRVIENPTKPEKTETDINDTDVSRDLIADENGYVGPEVHVGDTITYRITWQNNAADAAGQPAKAKITITDELDPGVEFVEASEPGRYDAAMRTVTWDLGDKDPKDHGFVTLKVRVTEKALQKVENQATVAVGNVSTDTDVIENPLEKVGALTVTKTVTGNLGDTTRNWHFRVDLGRPITGTYGDMTFDRGVAEFTLKHGESATALNLPAGITYTVTEAEANADGYTTQATGESGTIPEGDTAEAKFVNDKDVPPPDSGKGHLIVTKTVTGNAGDTGREWHFRVQLSDRNVNGRFGDMNFTNGVAEFTLKHGENAAALNLPAGITYTVTEAEANADGYTTQATGASGTIPDGGTAQADFVNSKSTTPTPTPPPPPGPTPTPGPDPTPTPSPTPPPEDETKLTPPSTRIPQTGDDSPLLLWMVMLAASALGLCVTVFVYWSRKGRRMTRQRKKQ